MSSFCDRHTSRYLPRLYFPFVTLWWNYNNAVKQWKTHTERILDVLCVCVWWGYVSDRPNQGTRLALTLFVNGLFPRIILIRASQDLRCSSARWLLQCWWMGIAFRLIAAPCFDNLPQLTGERAAATFTNWTDYCKMFFSSLESAGWRQRGSSVACTARPDELHSFRHVMFSGDRRNSTQTCGVNVRFGGSKTRHPS